MKESMEEREAQPQLSEFVHGLDGHFLRQHRLLMSVGQGIERRERVWRERRRRWEQERQELRREQQELRAANQELRERLGLGMRGCESSL